ncbi:hypothetical protein LCGC14_1821100 [marine sediment metagenome]|uniref:Uncharacterized protein n=1 Tax=marine sediment metagenome TaxID=412755 RepID=A0A0F9GIY8_9ZZZZ
MPTEMVKLRGDIRNKADLAKHLFDLAELLSQEVPAVATLLYATSGAIFGGKEDDLAEWVGFYVKKAIETQKKQGG